MMKKIILLSLVLLSSLGLRAQVSINTDNSNADPSAMLDVKSTGKGILIPRMTAAERDAIAAPANGLLVYVTTDSAFYFYEVSNWAKVGRAGWSLSGNTGTNPATNFLGTTDDVPLIFRVNNTPAFRLEYAAKNIGGTNSPAPNVIGGFSGNKVAEDKIGGAISGGGIELDTNSITADFGTIGGGRRNRVYKDYGTVSGGFNNYSNGASATVSGGAENFASGESSTVSGGGFNGATGKRTTVSGGGGNYATGNFATISGGEGNYATGIFATISGGEGNIANGMYSGVTGGGFENRAGGDYSLASGRRAIIDANHDGAFLFSDQNNFDFNSAAANEFAARATGGVRFVTAIDDSGNPAQTVSIDNNGTVTAAAFVGDGSGLTNVPMGNGWRLTGNTGTDTTINFIGTTDNVPLNFRVNNTRALRLEYAEFSAGNPIPNIISGYSGNWVSNGACGATIVGGGGPYSGYANRVTGNWGTIVGGKSNSAEKNGASIIGGESNHATADLATVLGGSFNNATGQISTITGGQDNNASGRFSTVLGGNYNTAAGFNSVAAGRRAKANHDGSFIFAAGGGGSIDHDFLSIADEEFAVLARGGVRFVTAVNGSGTPTQTVSIDNAGKVTAAAFVGDGSGLTGFPDNQTLSLSGATLSIEDGNSVSLSGINTDDQTLSLSGTTLSIESGNSVNLSALGADNLGNHTATQNLKLNGHYLSGDGGNAGIFVDAGGKVGIGDNTPAEALEVTGNAQLTGDDPDLVFFDHTGTNGTRTSAIRNTLVSQLGSDAPAAQKMQFFVNDAHVLTLQGDSKIGIGTTTPVNALSVTGAGDFSGNLGIGTTTPAARLDVVASGDGASMLRLSSDRAWAFQQEGVNNNANLRLRNIVGVNKSLYIDTDGSTVFRSQNGSSNLVTIQHTSGKVGIGTVTPQAALHVAGNVAAANGDGNFFWYAFPDQAPTRDISDVPNVIAYFEGSIMASEAVASMNVSSWSDARAKEILGRSNGKKDLELLKQIRITDYRWKDTREDHGRVHKKVIAQEVEQILPDAVGRMRKAIPNVYENATKANYDSLTRQLTIFLDKEHGFEAGDEVRVFTNAEDLEEVEVLKIPSPNSFTIAAKKATGAFVFGKWVDDYRNVDYDAISMLNVSATQELVKQTEEQQCIIETQEKRIAELEAQLSQLEILKTQNTQLAADIEAIKTALSRSPNTVFSNRNQ